ncbi:hypothetical protein Tco_1454730 [Tanacetum coccineum]
MHEEFVDAAKPGDGAQICEFEDVVRMSKDLYEFIPTLRSVKGALAVAKSWLTKSKPILVYDLSVIPVSNSLLRVDTLKILVSESIVLKILLEEWSLLEDFLENFMHWESNAYTALDDA